VQQVGFIYRILYDLAAYRVESLKTTGTYGDICQAE